MADDSGGEKVFPASPRRRREARKKGQVAKSHDLAGALVLLSLLMALRFAMTHGIVLDYLGYDIHKAFSFDAHRFRFDQGDARLWEIDMARSGAIIMVPCLLTAYVIALVTNVAQVGLEVAPEALVPDFNRVNPATGLKRILSTHGLVELAKGSLKMTLIGWICWAALRDNMPMIVNGMQIPLVPYISQVGEVVWQIGLHVCSCLFILAAADYAYQKYDFEKNMRMSREEMKQETKQSDGDPQIKQRIRQKQRALAQKRMMQQVPKATVVVTNPTHYAVALKYDKTMTAPVVVARGQDLIALRIKEIAKEHGVPTVENVPVARALYHDVRLGYPVPPQLYQAVAQILAFVYRTRKAA